MSDPVDDAFEKYIISKPQEESQSHVGCPKCESDDVDRRAGYRGEYRCLNCGYHWQVGGGNAS